MARTTSDIDDAAREAAGSGTGLLFWGWIVVTALNLGMVTASLILFAP